MAFLGELFTYSFKYIILLAVTVIAVICGMKYRKYKTAKTKDNAQNNVDTIQDTTSNDITDTNIES